MSSSSGRGNFPLTYVIQVQGAEAEKNLHLSQGRGKKRCDGIPSQVKLDDSKSRTKACKKVKIHPETFSLGRLPNNKIYNKSDEELDKEIQKIFNDYNIEEGRIKEGETAKLFPDQLEPLRSYYLLN